MRKVLGLLIACLLVLIPVGVVGAATTADIAINATPAFVSISKGLGQSRLVLIIPLLKDILLLLMTPR